MLCGTQAFAGLDGSPVQRSPPQPPHFHLPQNSPQPSPQPSYLQQSPQHPQQSPQHPQQSPQQQPPLLSKALLQDSPAAVKSNSMNLSKQQGPPPPQSSSSGRFCGRHDSTEKRHKLQESSLKGCQKCQMQLNTNYAELKLCPGCSESDNRCMICGVFAAEPRLAATPVRSMILNNSRPSPCGGPSPGAYDSEQLQAQPLWRPKPRRLAAPAAAAAAAATEWGWPWLERCGCKFRSSEVLLPAQHDRQATQGGHSNPGVRRLQH